MRGYPTFSQDDLLVECTIQLMKVKAGMTTRFGGVGSEFKLDCLCGQPFAQGAQPATQGMALVRVDGRRYEGAALRIEAAERDGTGARCRWCVGETGVRLEAVWTVDAATGVVSRRDRLTNGGDRPVILTGCVTRMVLPRGAYECYTQSSQWCNENQGAWQDLHTGLRLVNVPGRTTEGATPYLAIRRKGMSEGLVFHILPRGDWIIRAAAAADMARPPFAVIEMGLSDEDLHRVIAPGASFELPEILCHELTGGQPHLAAPALHRYLLAHCYADAKPEAPVVYNTWFDLFEILDVPRLRRQLAAAKEVGCEVFVIDAGWFGAGEGDWATQIGDWREKTEAAFEGRMKEFADKVRDAGLGFGIWMEPERFGPRAPVCDQHPEWFRQGTGYRRIDPTQPAARAWLRAEIGRLVETYRLAWMKVDFNFSLGRDDSGAQLADYYAAWYALMDEVRAAYPQTFFEGCASGGLRLDIESLRHFDGHFLSDTVNPVEMLRISQGAWLRIPPGRITRWTVLRNAGRVAPQYGRNMDHASPVLLASGGALWEPIGIEMDFALSAALPGMFGLSGDLDSLTSEQRARMAEGVAFFKRWRRFMTRAIAHQLTPPEPMSSREGWVGVQLQDSPGDTSLVFLCAMSLAGAPPPLRMQALDPVVSYELRRGFEGTLLGSQTGAELMGAGLAVQKYVASCRTAEVIVIQRRGTAG